MLEFLWSESQLELRNDLAGTSIVLFHNTLQRFLSTSSNVDLGTVGNQCLGDHKADACPSTGHNGCQTGDVEELGTLELVIVFSSCRHCSCCDSEGTTIDEGFAERRCSSEQLQHLNFRQIRTRLDVECGVLLHPVHSNDMMTFTGGRGMTSA